MPFSFIKARSIVPVIFLFPELCIGQVLVASTSLRETSGTIACPTGCVVVADPGTVRIVSVGERNFTIYTTTASYFEFTEYQVASSSLATAGQCVTVQGSPIVLPSIFTVPLPTAVDDSAFQYNVTSSLIDFIGLSSCTPSFPKPTAFIQVTSAASTETASSVSATLSTPNSVTLSPTGQGTAATSPASSTRKNLSPRSKVAISVVCTALVIGLIILGTLIWHKRRKRRIAAATTPAAIEKDQPSSTEDPQPYLQQKSELEAEEARKHELHADEPRYELADDTIHEIQDPNHSHEILADAKPVMPSLKATQELKGEEHSKELGAD